MNTEKVKTAVRALSSKKGIDIKVLKVHDLTVLADYFVICTGNSSTHIKSLADECEYQLEESGEKMLHREGKGSGSWVLLDFADISSTFTASRQENFTTSNAFGATPRK